MVLKHMQTKETECHEAEKLMSNTARHLAPGGWTDQSKTYNNVIKLCYV